MLFIRPETGSLKNSHRVVFLVADGNMVKPGTPSVVYLFCLGSEYIIHVNGFEEIDGGIQCHR